MTLKKAVTLTIVILFVFLNTACQVAWQVDLITNGETTDAIQSDMVKFYVNELGDETETILLAHILYHYGFTLIDQISLVREDGLMDTFDWETVAESAAIGKNGGITINSESFSPTAMKISPSPLSTEIEMTIMDLAPTIAKVLDLPALPDAQGQPRSNSKSKHAVLILVDGMQYQKLLTMIEQGSLSFFSEVSQIHRGITVYPSVTTSSTAALLTGAPPRVNSVYGYGYRSTEATTLFDLIIENGRSVKAVEGNSLAFNLRNADVELSSDRDGDGHTDDNVLANSLEVIQSSMPDLLFIHFHDVDDMGHAFGPDAPEYEAAIARVDGYLSKIFAVLPANTFIIIFADHGMQNIPNETGGNHGQLTHSAMLIPIIFLEK